MLNIIIGQRNWKPSGMALWLDANTLSLNDGDLVSSFPDTSGNGRTATASGAASPVFKKNIINGRPVVRFNGTSNVLTTALNVNSAPGFYYAAAWKRTGDFAGFNNYSTTSGFLGYSSATAKACMDGRPSGGAYFSSKAGSASTSFCVAEGAYDKSSLIAYADGSAGTPASISTSNILALSSTYIGALVANSQTFCSFDLVDLIIYLSVPSLELRKRIEQFLAIRIASATV